MLAVKEGIRQGNIMVKQDTVGANNPNWKGGETKRGCKQCGKAFWIRRAHAEQGRGIFCSKKCRGIWTSENIRGKDSHGWKGGKIKRICQTCGKEFEVFPCYVKNGGGKFCCNLCNRKAIPHHHTKPELIFEKICKKHGLHFKYTGDGSLWIGKKGAKQLNPDFIQADGQKIIVEIFGNYWHSPLLRKTMREQDTLKYRKNHYQRYKWKPIFIWETDLLRQDAEQFVLNTLLEVRK